MSYNEQDVYRIPPSPSMTGVMWRDAYFEKCAEVHRVRACAQEDLDANAAELTRLRGIAARAEEAERESADIVKAYEEGMERISRKEGYVELENKIVELAAELEEAVAHAKRLEEYMLKGVAFRDELQGQLCAAREAGERMVWCDVMSALRSSSPCAHAKEAERMKEQKDEAYTERNRVVALLSAIYPSHLCVHDPNDTTWEDGWRTIVCIHSPNGQLTWHLHDSHVLLFDHLEMGHTHWDGHTTEEKYRRVDELRLRGIAENEKGLLDIIKRDEAELKSLRSLAERAEDVDALTAAILSVSFDREDESWADTVARRVRAYLKEGR